MVEDGIDYCLEGQTFERGKRSERRNFPGTYEFISNWERFDRFIEVGEQKI